MTQPSSHRLLFCVVAIAAASAGGAAYLSIGSGPVGDARLEHDGTTPLLIESATHPPPATAMDTVESPPALAARSSNTNQPSSAGNPIVTVLPPSMLESARTTSWDEQTSAALERFMVAIFDADGDGMLNDFERIIAVRALRDAVWPSAPNEATESMREAGDEASGLATAATLSAQDRRLHHDVDEARRRDRQEGGGIGNIDADLRAEILRRFHTDDDGHLTVDEFARYMAHRNAGSAVADLNRDGQVDDADLRVFLDVASPID